MTKNSPTSLIELNRLIQRKHEHDGESFPIEITSLPQCRVNGIHRVKIEEVFDCYSAPKLLGTFSLRALLAIKYAHEPDELRRPFAIVDDMQNLYAYEVALNHPIEQQIVEGLPEFLNLTKGEVRLILENEL